MSFTNFYGNENVMNTKVLDWITEKIIILYNEPELDNDILEKFNAAHNLTNLYNDLKDSVFENTWHEYKYSVIYNRVVHRLQHHEDVNNLAQFLYINLVDSLESCSSGRFGKLISTMSSHFDDMTLNFKQTEIMHYGISHIFNQFTDKEINYDTAVKKVKDLCKEFDATTKMLNANLKEFEEEKQEQLNHALQNFDPDLKKVCIHLCVNNNELLIAFMKMFFYVIVSQIKEYGLKFVKEFVCMSMSITIIMFSISVIMGHNICKNIVENTYDYTTIVLFWIMASCLTIGKMLIFV